MLNAPVKTLGIILKLYSNDRPFSPAILRLGYTPDIRNHPATEYLHSGMALALCSDDPAYMENEILTDDFLAAIISWNLHLDDIKQLGINSILYCGLKNAEKYTALGNYNNPIKNIRTN